MLSLTTFVRLRERGERRIAAHLWWGLSAPEESPSPEDDKNRCRRSRWMTERSRFSESPARRCAGNFTESSEIIRENGAGCALSFGPRKAQLVHRGKSHSITSIVNSIKAFIQHFKENFLQQFSKLSSTFLLH